MQDEEIPDVDTLLRPSLTACITTEFFSATAHVPMSIALATLLVRPIAEWPVLIPLLAGAFIQAWMIGSRSHAGKRPFVLHGLIGSGLYGCTLVAVHGTAAASDGLLQIYLVSSLLAAGCTWAGMLLRGLAAESAHVAAHVVRTLAMVGVYAAVGGDADGGFRAFLVEPEHVFLCIGTALLGLALGVSAVVHRRDRTRLAATAARLRSYSEMLLGESRLTRAIGREDDLKPRRTRRSVLFADVRGFTKWSESHSPEEVLQMLNGVYTAAEESCAVFKPVRTKHTGDEVMMFFVEPLAAAQAALAMRDAVGVFLQPYGLHVGIGINHGDVIEGLFGSSRTKAYDILGDTVNTAKRVSDHAKSGGVVVTFVFFEACRGRIEIAGDQRINAKGKSSVILVAELLGVRSAVEG